MERIRVKTGEGGKVRIVIKEPKESSSGAKPIYKKNALLLSTNIIELMEIRAESAFRPNQEDVEIIYALSGTDPNIPDKIHYLASGQVVLDSSANFILSYTENVIETILKEREDSPEIVIHIHTHPMGVPNLSEADKKENMNIVEAIDKLIPQASIIFGVHAISSDDYREKTEPKANNNKIRWSSIHRVHDVGFYDKDGKQYRVDVIE